MRLVFDTEITLSGLMGSGAPCALLKAAGEAQVRLFSSGPLAIDRNTACRADPRASRRRSSPVQVCLISTVRRALSHRQHQPAHRTRCPVIVDASDGGA